MAYRCTAEYPWTNEKGPVVHVEAHEVGDQRDGYPSGDLVIMYCPNCGHRWEKELPQ
jgi:hypothetical protein